MNMKKDYVSPMIKECAINNHCHIMNPASVIVPINNTVNEVSSVGGNSGMGYGGGYTGSGSAHSREGSWDFDE